MKLTTPHHIAVRDQLAIPMTSMIDVVFLLLIFFLVTTTFVRPERQLVSGISIQDTNAGLQPTDLEPAVIDIYRMGDQVLYQLGALKTTDLQQLNPIATGFENKADGGFVRVAPGVPFEDAAKAIGFLKSHGFTTVTYVPVQ